MFLSLMGVSFVSSTDTENEISFSFTKVAEKKAFFHEKEQNISQEFHLEDKFWSPRRQRWRWSRQ